MSIPDSNAHPPAEPNVVKSSALIRPTSGAPLSHAAAPGFAPANEAVDGSGVGRYAHALRRRWLLSLVLAIPLSAGAAYAAWTLQPQRYTATAVVQLAPADARIAFATADQSGPGSHSNFDSFKKTQRLRLKQRYLITRALDPAKHPTLHKLPVMRDEDDPVQWVEQHVNVTFPDDAELMYVSLTANDPTGLHDVINSVVAEYFDEVVLAERRRKTERVATLQKLVEDAENELRKKQTGMKRLVDAVGTGNKDALTDVQRNAVNQLYTFVQQMARVKFDLLQARVDLKHAEELQNAPNQEIPVTDAELAAAMEADALVKQYRLEQQRLVTQIESIRGRIKEARSDEMLTKPTRQLEAIGEKVAARKTELRGVVVEAKKAAAAAEIERLKSVVRRNTSQYNELDVEAKTLQAEAKKTGHSSIDVEMLTSEIAAHAEILKSLRDEYERTKVEMPTNRPDQQTQDPGSRIRVMQEAMAARPADSKVRIMTTIAAGGASFLLPFVLLVFLDASKNRISTGAEVTQAVGLSVIGAVPILPRRVIRRLNGPSETDKYWRSLLSESVDSIAAVLLHGVQPGGSRVIMVSSANAGEGKTTLAAHLAVSLAGAGRHPVLVDFDLRRPALHRVFGVALQPGVNEILRDGHDLDAALQATQVPNLMMLSAGRWSKTGLAGLVAADLQSLFTRLRSEFDFVVVDACPILPVVDTRLIGQHVDAVLLSVLRDVSRAPKLRAACELLDLFGIPVLGVVVTGSSEEIYKDSRYEPLSEAQAV